MKNDDTGSLYELIEGYVYLHEPCTQADVVRAFSGQYNKQYITKTCKQLWEDARIWREKSGSTYILKVWYK